MEDRVAPTLIFEACAIVCVFCLVYFSQHASRGSEILSMSLLPVSLGSPVSPSTVVPSVSSAAAASTAAVAGSPTPESSSISSPVTTSSSSGIMLLKKLSSVCFITLQNSFYNKLFDI